MPIAATASPPLQVVPEVGEVVPLDPHEVYRAQAFHAGHLWLGHSTGTVADYRLDAHAPCGRLVASATVPHTVEFLHPFGAGAVLAVGKHHLPRKGWRTYHSVARLVKGSLRVRTRTMPAALQVEQFGGSPGAMFFNETGMGRVIRWNGLWGRPLPPRVGFPGTMLHCGRWLFVLERNDFRPGNESIARIDLARGTIERTFAGTRRRLTTLLDLAGLPWIAAPEAWADRVLLVDKASNRLAAEIAVEGSPVEVARLGHCLVVFASESRRASFFDLAADGFPLLAEWDLAGLGDAVRNVRAMDVDPASGNLYLRSPFHPRIAGGRATVLVAADPDGATRARCIVPGEVRPPSPAGRRGGHAAA